MSVRATPITLEGKYQLLEEIGRGGMGAVFHARDITLDRSVAVKFLLPELLDNKELVERFHVEARAMATVQHPNVAQIYSFGWYGEMPFFVMEYATGQTADRMLETAARRETDIPIELALNVIDQAVAGLEAVHQARVVHRDVKPGNLIVQAERNRALLMDFGIGHRVVPGEPIEPPVGGSPAYMAPETISGEGIAPKQEYLADIYALGITAFELITGTLPREFETWVEALTWHVSDTPPPPSSRRLGLPPGVDEVVLKCLAKDPAERYQSCRELHEALAEPLAKVKRWPRPRRERRPPSPVMRRSQVVETRPPMIALVQPGPRLERQVQRALEAAGQRATVEAVAHPREALELTSERVGVIITRLHNEEVNGLEVAATISGDPTLRRTRVILTSDTIDDLELEVLERLGVVTVLTRPVELPELTDALVMALLPRRQRLVG